MSKVSIGPQSVFFPQPVFLIGTYREDGKPDFAPITWVSYTFGPPPSIVISMFGRKMTKDNIFRTGVFSANLASTDMLELTSYLGTTEGSSGPKDALPYEYSDGEILKVPVLKKSKWVYECQVSRTFEMPESHTFICEIKNIQIDESLSDMTLPMVDLRRLDPIIYAGFSYFGVGQRFGTIEDFCKRPLAG